MGPIQIMLFAFEDFAATGGIVDELDSLSSSGVIRVIDARFLLKDEVGELLAVRATDLTDHERDDLRAAAGALIGMGAGLVAGGEEGAVAGAILGAESGYWMGDQGLSAAEIAALGDELAPGDALLMLVIDNSWAERLRDAIRDAGAVSARSEYVTPEGLMALGAMLELAAEE